MCFVQCKLKTWHRTAAADRSVFCHWPLSGCAWPQPRATRAADLLGLPQTSLPHHCVGRPPRYTRPHVPKCPAEEGLRVQMRTDRTAPLSARSCGASSVQDPSAHTHAHAQGEMAAAFNAVPEQISMSGTPMAKTFMAGFQMTHADGGQSPTASNSAHD